MIRTPRFWYIKRSWISFLLWPVSYVGSLFSMSGYRDNAYCSKTLVVCVGNFVVGGSGKSTIVSLIADLLSSDGKRVAILSKGYKGTYTQHKINFLKIDCNKHTADLVGDEPMMLANKKYDVYVSNNRVLAVKRLENLYDVILLDDGMQDSTLKKSLVVCAIKEGFEGNNFFLPAGPLRQRLKDAIHITDVIVSIGNISDTYGKPFFKVIIDGVSCPPVTHAFLFTGIAHPEDFFSLFQKSCPHVHVVGTKAFPDHYAFTKNDERILREQAGNSALVTTEKDFQRLHDKKNIFCSQLNVRFEDPEQVRDFLIHHLENANQKEMSCAIYR